MTPSFKAAAAEPITIRADQFEMLLAERQTTYTGNVVATQGERAIRGAELIVHFNDDNEVTFMRATGENLVASEGGRAIRGVELIVHFNDDNEIATMRATGKPATLTDTEEDPPITLVGTTLNYDTDESLVRAEGGSTLSQGEDTITAETIVYDLDEERAQAVSNPEQRVRLMLAPRKTNDQN